MRTEGVSSVSFFEKAVVIIQSDCFFLIVDADQKGSIAGIQECRHRLNDLELEIRVLSAFVHIPSQGRLEFAVGILAALDNLTQNLLFLVLVDLMRS